MAIGRHSVVFCGQSLCLLLLSLWSLSKPCLTAFSRCMGFANTQLPQQESNRMVRSCLRWRVNPNESKKSDMVIRSFVSPAV